MRLGLESFLLDLRVAVRGLIRRPALALTAILAASLGVGTTTAVFSVVDRILFRPLPYANESRIVSVGLVAPVDTNEFMFAEGYFDLRRNPGPMGSSYIVISGGINSMRFERAGSGAAAVSAIGAKFPGSIRNYAGRGAFFHAGGGFAERSARGHDFLRAVAQPVRCRPESDWANDAD